MRWAAQVYSNLPKTEYLAGFRRRCALPSPPSRSPERAVWNVFMRYLQVVLGQLNTTIGMPAHSPQQAEKIAQLQGQFCGMLQVCMERLCRTDDSKAALLPYADQVGAAWIGALRVWLPH